MCHPDTGAKCVQLLLDLVFRKGDVFEELDGAVGSGGRPVADDFTVEGDDGVEDAALVVGVVGAVGVEDDIAALVADQVFVERR